MEDRPAKCVSLLFSGAAGRLVNPGSKVLTSAELLLMEQDSWGRGTGDHAANGFELWWPPSISSTIALIPRKPQASKEADGDEGINLPVPTTAS